MIMSDSPNKTRALRGRLNIRTQHNMGRGCPPVGTLPFKAWPLYARLIASGHGTSVRKSDFALRGASAPPRWQSAVLPPGVSGKDGGEPRQHRRPKGGAV